MWHRVTRVANSECQNSFLREDDHIFSFLGIRRDSTTFIFLSIMSFAKIVQVRDHSYTYNSHVLNVPVLSTHVSIMLLISCAIPTYLEVIKLFVYAGFENVLSA